MSKIISPKGFRLQISSCAAMALFAFINTGYYLMKIDNAVEKIGFSRLNVSTCHISMIHAEITTNGTLNFNIFNWGFVFFVLLGIELLVSLYLLSQWTQGTAESETSNDS